MFHQIWRHTDSPIKTKLLLNAEPEEQQLCFDGAICVPSDLMKHQIYPYYIWKTFAKETKTKDSLSLLAVFYTLIFNAEFLYKH